MKVGNNYTPFRPESLGKLPSQKSVSSTKTVKAGSFLDQLRQEQLKSTSSEDLKISKHAQERMQERDISISPEKWQTINQKVDQAKAMGITDSLVLTDKEAMVVSAANKTVITVMNREEAANQIFTNINGTIVLG